MSKTKIMTEKFELVCTQKESYLTLTVVIGLSPHCVWCAHMWTHEGVGTLTSAGNRRQELDLQDPPTSLSTVLF